MMLKKMKLPLRLLVPVALLVGSLAWSNAARAVCTNDVDCPGTACGDQVCSWATATHTCVPAGTAPQGTDGWCTSNTDCKCMGEGATCVGVHCSFTLPDAGTSTTVDGGAGNDSGTTTGDDGGTTTGDDAGTSAGSDSGAVTTRTDSGTDDDAGSGSGSSDSGGCSLGGGEGTSSAPIFGVALIGLAGLFTRRRRAR